MSHKEPVDVSPHPRYLITMRASAVQATLTALHATFKEVTFVVETFSVEETIAAEDKKSQILRGVFFDERIPDTHMADIDLAIKQLQEHGHEIGYTSDKLKQLIIEGFPGDDKARNKDHIMLYLEKEEFKVAVVNAIKMLRKPDSAVVLLTTSDLDCLLKSHHVMDGSPFTIRECRNPPGLKEFGPNFRLQWKPSDEGNKFKSDALSSASQGRSLSPEAGSNTVRGQQQDEPMNLDPREDWKIRGDDSQGSKESRQPTHGGFGEEKIAKVPPRNRGKSQQAQGNVSSMPQSNLDPGQKSPSAHHNSSYSGGESAHSNVGHGWNNQTSESRIPVDSFEKLSLIFWMCISKKLGVEGDAVQFDLDVESLSLIVRGPTSAVHITSSYVKQMLLPLDTVRTQVNIRSDLARKLAEKVEPPYKSWVANFVKEQGYPPVTIRSDLAKKLADKVEPPYNSWVGDFMEEQGYPPVTFKASIVGDKMVLEVVAFNQGEGEANRMAHLLKKRLVCANVPCDKTYGYRNGFQPPPREWNQWEKEYIVVINAIEYDRKVEVYGIPKDVIKVVDLMYEWVHKNSS